MADDSDLADLLPEPPPPRPVARDAAIAAAMRRFDGVPDPQPAAAPDRRPAQWLSGKRIGAFATVVLVAGISLSIALNRPGGLQPGRVEPSAVVTAPRPAPEPDRSSAPKPGTTNAAEEPTPVAKPEPPIQKSIASAVPVVSAGEADRSTSADQAPSASPPPPPSPAPPAPEAAPPMAWAAPKEAPSAAADRGAIVVTGSRVRSRVAQSASPVSVVNNKADEESGGGDIVITGAHRRPNAYAARGDWNACTVIDPDESLRGCRALIGIGAKGPTGEAAKHLSDGLALAWRGDLDGAIAAFDRAIALKPKFAFAYLNRGLAYQRQGETGRAAADLDLAIKYAPYAARGYYNRGVLRRELGNRRGADADANRAAELDSDYPDPAQ